MKPHKSPRHRAAFNLSQIQYPTCDPLWTGLLSSSKGFLQSYARIVINPESRKIVFKPVRCFPAYVHLFKTKNARKGVFCFKQFW